MQTLSSLIRHGVTYVIGMLSAWMAVNLTGPDIAEATAAAEAMIEPLVVVSGFVAVILARLAMPVFNKIFRMGSGENDDDRDKDNGGGSGRTLLLVIACTAVGLGSLPSCSQFSPPVGIAVEGPGYQVSYQFAK